MKNDNTSHGTTGPEHVVLNDVAGQMVDAIIEALAGCSRRQLREEGVLGVHKVLHGVSWDDYQGLLSVVGDRHLCHTYCEGVLEVMEPPPGHGRIVALLSRLVHTMTYTLAIPIQSVGSMTLGLASAECGLEPCSSYYVASEPRVRGKEIYEPGIDPPPDLVIEVDVPCSWSDRLWVLARLGVPEVWRYDGQGVKFLRLAHRPEYSEIGRSREFPFLGSEDIGRFVARRRTDGENALVRAFNDWVTVVARGEVDSGAEAE